MQYITKQTIKLIKPYSPSSYMILDLKYMFLLKVVEVIAYI